MYKNIPEDQQDIFAAKVSAAQPSGYKYPTTYNEYWNTVDEYWIQLLKLFASFLPEFLPNDPSGKNPLDIERTHIIAETLRRTRNPLILVLFNSTWSCAPDDGRIHLLGGWNVLCDLCSEGYLLEYNEIEKIATEEQKQIALSVAIDAYDKKQTYVDELKKLVKKDI
jgi:hypothetical protein